MFFCRLRSSPYPSAWGESRPRTYILPPDTLEARPKSRTQCIPAFSVVMIPGKMRLRSGNGVGVEPIEAESGERHVTEMTNPHPGDIVLNPRWVNSLLFTDTSVRSVLLRLKSILVQRPSKGIRSEHQVLFSQISVIINEFSPLPSNPFGQQYASPRRWRGLAREDQTRR
jgi:hypothetical protein